MTVNKLNYHMGGHEWQCVKCEKLYTYKHDAEECCKGIKEVNKKERGGWEARAEIQKEGWPLD